MNDIGLTWNNVRNGADVTIANNDLQADDGLETAVMLSLFLDRRLEDSDVLPPQKTDRRGWWADAFPVVEGDKIGSRLWLLSRVKLTTEVQRLAKEYAEEALAWLVEDKVASRVAVESGIVAKGMLTLSISIYRPKAESVKNFRYSYNWISQEAKRG